MTFRPNRTAGFTLVELLVVIAIIGILIGMLIPAVQHVREAARRTSCLNNFRQIGLALHNYEGARRRLPNGINSPSATEFASSTWLTQILPFIEQQAVWDDARSDYASTPSPFFDHLGMKRVIPTFNCPSDPSSGVAHWTSDGTGNYVVASTNYLGVNGTNFEAQDGMFYLNSETRFAEVTDGLSNTLLVGERPPSPDYWYGWWYAGYGQGASGSPDMVLGTRELNRGATFLDHCDVGPYHFERGSNEMCDTLHFWSHHPGGANFVLADGSVKFISYDADPVMPALSTRAGDEVINEDW